MPDRGEVQETASRIILQGSKNYTQWRSYRAQAEEVNTKRLSTPYLIPTNTEIPAKAAEVLLQAGLLTGMGNEYSSIVSMMETEWKMGTTNIAESVKKLIRFAEIRKENDQASRPSNTPKQSALLTSKPPKPSNRAPPGTCTNPDCIKKGNTQHYTDRCFLRYPELRPKHSLHQMRTKGSKPNLQSQSESPSETPSRES